MEFNSLSVVYGRPSEMFLRDQVLKQSIAAEKKYYPKERGFKTADNEKLLQDEPAETQNVDNLLEMDIMGGSTQAEPSNLLDTGIDLLGTGESFGTTTDANTNSAQNISDLLGSGPTTSAPSD